MASKNQPARKGQPQQDEQMPQAGHGQGMGGQRKNDEEVGEPVQLQDDMTGELEGEQPQRRSQPQQD